MFNKISVSLKGQVYHMVVIPALFYGAECWPDKRTQVQRLMVAEIRMIQWMCRNTWLDKIRNEVIREKVKVAPIKEKLRETRLRWFGHIKRRGVNALVRRYEAINFIHCRRGMGWPKMSWNGVIRGDLKSMGLIEDMTQDKKFWRIRIRTVVHKWFSGSLIGGLLLYLFLPFYTIVLHWRLECSLV